VLKIEWSLHPHQMSSGDNETVTLNGHKSHPSLLAISTQSNNIDTGILAAHIIPIKFYKGTMKIDVVMTTIQLPL
jgi:hypothetical protein